MAQVLVSLGIGESLESPKDYIFHYIFQDCLRGLMEEEQDWIVEVDRVLMLQELTSCWTEELQRYRMSTR